MPFSDQMDCPDVGKNAYFRRAFPMGGLYWLLKGAASKRRQRFSFFIAFYGLFTEYSALLPALLHYGKKSVLRGGGEHEEKYTILCECCGIFVFLLTKKEKLFSCGLYMG